jgi:hypothetical protein
MKSTGCKNLGLSDKSVNLPRFSTQHEPETYQHNHIKTQKNIYIHNRGEKKITMHPPNPKSSNIE